MGATMTERLSDEQAAAKLDELIAAKQQKLATMKDSHGQTVQPDELMCEYCGGTPCSCDDPNCICRRNSPLPTPPTIVQDYREYTAEEILHGILQFSERSGWGDPANLGHWLGAAQRWAKTR
jgi:hypothetical protein